MSAQYAFSGEIAKRQSSLGTFIREDAFAFHSDHAG